MGEFINGIFNEAVGKNEGAKTARRMANAEFDLRAQQMIYTIG